MSPPPGCAYYSMCDPLTVGSALGIALAIGLLLTALSRYTTTDEAE